jgi:hypothetical protein
MLLNENRGNCSVPTLDYKRLLKESEEIVEKDKNDKRDKTFTLDKITEKSTDLEVLTVAIQPELKTETDLETNMFSPYPQSDIPFSNSTSWIGQ